MQNKCEIGDSPLSFLENENGEYDINMHIADIDLLNSIRSGKSMKHMGNGHIIDIGSIFGGTFPDMINQDMVTGQNDLVTAEALHFQYPYQMN